MWSHKKGTLILAILVKIRLKCTFCGIILNPKLGHMCGNVYTNGLFQIPF